MHGNRAWPQQWSACKLIKHLKGIYARELDVLSFPDCTTGVWRIATPIARLANTLPMPNGSGNTRRRQRLPEAALNHRIRAIQVSNGYAWVNVGFTLLPYLQPFHGLIAKRARQIAVYWPYDRRLAYLLGGGLLLLLPRRRCAADICLGRDV